MSGADLFPQLLDDHHGGIFKAVVFVPQIRAAGSNEGVVSAIQSEFHADRLGKSQIDSRIQFLLGKCGHNRTIPEEQIGCKDFDNFFDGTGKLSRLGGIKRLEHHGSSVICYNGRAIAERPSYG